LPDPEAGPGQVVVDIAYAAVNYPDALVINDEYQVKAPAPLVPGSEFAGVVAAVGDGVEDVEVGNNVLGACLVGAYAEKIALDATSVQVIPDSVDLRDAAAFRVAHYTAMHALRTVADLQPGETLLVLGAAGGVGLATVELATHLGGRVVAAASSPDKLELCSRYGAVAGIDYTTEDLEARAKELTDGGADVVIDPVGGVHSEQALRATRWGSRFIVLGFASGEIPCVPLDRILLGGIIVRGMQIRSITQYEPAAAERDRRELRELFLAGKIHPHVSAVYRLADAAAALRSLLDRTATGKVLIDVRA
jgi:NADPH2:quinone reductase